jgi:hypothetical protein
MKAKRARLVLARLALDEGGYALVLALMAMTVFAIAGGAAAMYAADGTTAAGRSNGGQSALALAEAGVNEASAVLFAAANQTSQASVPIPSTIPISPQHTVNGAREFFWGVYDANAATWTLSGRGMVPNNASPGSWSTRTVTRKLKFVPDLRPYGGVLFANSTSGCAITINNGVTVADKAYSRGDFCILGGSTFSGDSLQAEGNLSISGGAYVGTAVHPIPEVHVVGSTSVTGGATYNATMKDHTVAGLTKPPLQIANAYSSADLGPSSSCTTGSLPGGARFDTNGVNDWNQPVFNLTPGGVPYQCTKTDAQGNVIAQLIWSGTWTTGTLQVKGKIFFDGPITMNGGIQVIYSGQGSIYAYTFDIGNGADLCAVSACANTWDGTTNVLVLVAGRTGVTDFNPSGGSIVQAAVYCAGNAAIGNGTTILGPVIAEQITITGGSFIPSVVDVSPTGAPLSASLQQISYDG